MKHDPEYHSYLLRLWRKEPANVEADLDNWQGEMIHIQTGRKWRLHDLFEMLVYLRAIIDSSVE